jgi:hypothetical protein
MKSGIFIKKNRLVSLCYVAVITNVELNFSVRAKLLSIHEEAVKEIALLGATRLGEGEYWSMAKSRPQGLSRAHSAFRHSTFDNRY